MYFLVCSFALLSNSLVIAAVQGLAETKSFSSEENAWAAVANFIDALEDTDFSAHGYDKYLAIAKEKLRPALLSGELDIKSLCVKIEQKSLAAAAANKHYFFAFLRIFLLSWLKYEVPERLPPIVIARKALSGDYASPEELQFLTNWLKKEPATVSTWYYYGSREECPERLLDDMRKLNAVYEEKEANGVHLPIKALQTLVSPGHENRSHAEKIRLWKLVSSLSFSDEFDPNKELPKMIKSKVETLEAESREREAREQAALAESKRIAGEIAALELAEKARIAREAEAVEAARQIALKEEQKQSEERQRMALEELDAPAFVQAETQSKKSADKELIPAIVTGRDQSQREHISNITATEGGSLAILLPLLGTGTAVGGLLAVLLLLRLRSLEKMKAGTQDRAALVELEKEKKKVRRLLVGLGVFSSLGAVGIWHQYKKRSSS